VIEKQSLLVRGVGFDIGKEDVVGCYSRDSAKLGGSCRGDGEEEEAVFESVSQKLLQHEKS